MKSKILTSLVHRFHTPPYEPKRLFNVLNLANMWQILQLRKWAILNIGILPTEVFDVMMKLRTSIQFKVEVWFESAFRELAFTDLRDMKDEQLEFIGMDVLVPLIRLYCEVETHKKSMVFNLPPCPAHSLKCIGGPSTPQTMQGLVDKTPGFMSWAVTFCIRITSSPSALGR